MMIEIRLEEREASVIGEVLESYLSDLRMEIADTDSMDFREALKAKKTVIEKLIRQIATS
jgi:hypothetical protein